MMVLYFGGYGNYSVVRGLLSNLFRGGIIDGVYVEQVETETSSVVRGWCLFKNSRYIDYVINILKRALAQPLFFCYDATTPEDVSSHSLPDPLCDLSHVLYVILKQYEDFVYKVKISLL